MKLLKQLLIINLIVFNLSLQAAEELNQTLRGQGGTGLTINDVRNFEIDQNTVIKEDGVLITALKGQGGTGFKVRYRIGDDVNPEIDSGTIEEIDLINTHKGPITSLDPFRIFNVDVLVTADTFFDDGLNFANLEVGDELKVSGFIDPNSSLLASRVEMDDDPLTEWKLSGYISGLTPTQLNIAEQVVLTGGILPDNCNIGLDDGVFIEIKASPDPAFTSGSTLENVTKIECVDEDIVENPVGVIPVAIEGIISTVADNGLSFTLSEQQINVGPNSTIFLNGDADDLLVGAKVEVEGTLDTATSEVNAIIIKFLEVRFKFEEPVMPVDVMTDQSIQLFGQTILTTPQLRDEDGVMLNGLTAETQVEVRGFIDADGQLYATRVRTRGTADSNDVELDGQTTEINQPFVTVSGVLVDTSSSNFFDFFGQSMTEEQFFAAISVGSEIEIEDATGDQSTDIISGGSIQIDDFGFDPILPPAINTQYGVGIGTITSKSDLITKLGFENPAGGSE